MGSDNFFQRIRQPGSPYQLAAFRIAVGAQIFYAAHSKIFDLLLVVGARQEVDTIFPQAMDDYITAYLVPSLILICKVLSGFLIVGLLTRIILPLLTLAFTLLFSYYYLGVNAPIHWLYLWFPLIVLCFADSARVLSIDSLLLKGRDIHDPQQYRWPVEMCRLWFVYIYFSAGLAKIFPIIKGITWIYGTTSKEIVYYRFLESPFFYIFGKPFFDYASTVWIFTLLSVLALLIELSTIVILFTSKYNLVVLVLVLCMHMFLYLTGVAGFMQTAIVLGITLLPVGWFTWRSNAVMADNVGVK